MKEKLEKLIIHLKQRQNEEMSLYKKREKISSKVFHNGYANAFAESVQLLTDILNSENPNSVSNQPDKG